MKGQVNASNFERTLFPEATYDMTLVKIMCIWGKPSQYAPEGAPKVMFIWKWVDEEGEEFELTDYMNFPKNINYNEKSGFWKRVGEIAGVTFSKENAGLLDIDFGDFIDTYADLVEHLQGKNEKGNNETAEARSLTVNDQQLIGVHRRLVVDIWQNDGKEGNNVVKVMQISSGAAGPKKPSRAAPSQTTAPTSQKLMDAPAPAPRPSSTEPMHASELPF